MSKKWVGERQCPPSPWRVYIFLAELPNKTGCTFCIYKNIEIHEKTCNDDT